MKWSRFQEAVFADVREGKGHTVIDACAGSGKSTSLIAALDHVPPRIGNRDTSVLVTSFGVRSVEDLKAKEPPWTVDLRTLNSLGNRALTQRFGPQKINKHRVYTTLTRHVLGENRETGLRREQLSSFRQRVKELVDFAKAAMINDPEGLGELADAREIDRSAHAWILERVHLECKIEDALGHVAAMVLKASREIDGSVDFNDQVWLPVVLGLDLQKFDYLFVDEAQDVSPMQFALLKKSMAPGARVFMFGQTIQSIYAFRGAGIGLEPFIRDLKAKVLPLSISYRCPKAVVRFAQALCPEMQSAPDALEGIIDETTVDRLPMRLVVGDWVLSRKNAPLIKLFLNLLERGVPAGIAGKDVARRIANFIDESGARTVQELASYTNEWRDKTIEQRRKKNPNAKVDQVYDHVACIRSICTGCSSIGEVRARIDVMMNANPTGKVVLSTIHQAKGLEAPRVFLLEATFPVCADFWIERGKSKDTAEFIAGRIMEEDQEEKNIRYVALTRAKEELVFVHPYSGVTFEDGDEEEAVEEAVS